MDSNLGEHSGVDIEEPRRDGGLGRREELSRRAERALRLPMLVLALLFLVIVALPELVEVSEATDELLDRIGWLIWAVFAFELVMMTYLAPDRRRYLMTHWLDVLTVLVPFLRPLRILQVAVVSARFWTEAQDVLRRRTFSVVGLSSLAVVWLAATLVYAAERGGDGTIRTYADALWWAASTVTTVGYGDVFPITPAGRGVAVLLMLVGISVFGLLTARVAAIFIKADEEDRLERKLDEVLARLERLEGTGQVRRPDDEEG